MKYDVIIIGAGPGGIFAAYELMQLKQDLKVAVFEAGHALSRRRCPIDGNKVKAIGTDGKTPVFGVDANGFWTVSYDDGKTYTQVIEATNISSATLSRVSRCVQYGEGYKKLLNK